MDNKLRISLVNCMHYKSTLREIVEPLNSLVFYHSVNRIVQEDTMEVIYV